MTQSLFTRWNGRCAYCGHEVSNELPSSDDLRATKDHFIPRRTGARGKNNTVLACRRCNAFKGATDPRTLISIWHKLDPAGFYEYVCELTPKCVLPTALRNPPGNLKLALPAPATPDGVKTVFAEAPDTTSPPPPKTIANGALVLGWQKPAASTALRKASTLPTPVLDGPDDHLITIAPTGAGKGVSCIIPALLSWDGPAVVIDPKGENYAVTARRRLELGQRVEVLDPFDVTAAPKKARLNPLDLVDIRSFTAEDDVAVIARFLSEGVTHRDDPFWDERAETVIRSIILDCLRDNPSSGGTSLGDVRRQVEQLDGPPRNQAHLSVPAYLQTGRQPKHISGLSVDRTRASILATAMAHLSIVRNGAVLSSLSDSTIALEEIISGAPLTIYIVLPPDKLDSHGKLLRLWLGVIMAALARRHRIPPKPTLLLIDEAAQLGTLDQLRTAVTLMRGYGVKVWSFWQDLSQLQRLYPDWPSILNNCAVQQFFGAASPKACAELETLLAGKAPCPVSALRQGEAIVIERGAVPARLRLPDYRRDSVFAGLADANPFYPAMPPASEPERSSETNIIAFPGRNLIR